MSIWSPQDVARDSVRRQAAGLTLAEVADKAAEAARRERETAADARHGTRRRTGLPGLEIDPQPLAETWAAKHAEWRRIETLLETTGQAAYAPETDTAGTRWAREREEYREERLAAFAAHRDHVGEQRAAVSTHLSLTPAQAAALQRAAGHTGLTPEQVLARLAARVETGPGGTLSVPAFHPDHL
ncbi:hypothetical protein ACFXHD_00265 [Streptomyces hydrogenans]|uniref:hypothetical protein n=1 Tax=Streptomyces hydrogenans TaxID=1873719 RepID=UPI0036CFD852